MAEDSKSVVIGTADGRTTRLRARQIIPGHPQPASLMPENLTVRELLDLLAFRCRYRSA